MTDEIRRLADDMADSMYAAEGIGLGALFEVKARGIAAAGHAHVIGDGGKAGQHAVRGAVGEQRVADPGREAVAGDSEVPGIRAQTDCRLSRFGFGYFTGTCTGIGRVGPGSSRRINKLCSTNSALWVGFVLNSTSK